MSRTRSYPRRLRSQYIQEKLIYCCSYRMYRTEASQRNQWEGGIEKETERKGCVKEDNRGEETTRRTISVADACPMIGEKRRGGHDRHLGCLVHRRMFVSELDEKSVVSSHGMI